MLLSSSKPELGGTGLRHSELSRTIVPLVTPLTPDEEFARQAMAKLFDFILQEGADALEDDAERGLQFQ